MLILPSRTRLLGGVAALSCCLVPPVHAQTQSPPPGDEAAISSRPNFWSLFSVENFVTALVHSALSSARVLADIKYDQISVDPVALRVTLTGVSISPLLPQPMGACLVTVDQITINGNPVDQLNEARFRMALNGVDMQPSCLPIEAAGMARGFGFASLAANRADLSIRYDYASGGGDLHLETEIENLATISAFVDASYLSYRMNMATEEPVIAADITRAEISVQDAGAWDLAKRMLPPGMLDPDALNQMVSGGVTELFQSAAMPNDTALSDEQRAFALEAGRVAAGFEGSNGRIVLATQIAPGDVVRVGETTFASLKTAMQALKPTIANTAPSLRATISVADLDAALNADSMPENAFELGKALITGIGAPRNPEAARKLLLPLARNGDARASQLIGEDIQTSHPKDAYEHALRAAAAGLPGALALLDRIERDLPYADVLSGQGGLLGSPEEALYSDLGAMRKAARDFLTGTVRPRSWQAAYYWASMSAAAGDASGAALRDDINQMMRLRGDGEIWAKEANSLDNGVLRDWIGRDVPGLLR